MYELNFITDLVEENLVKGKLRWLANFSEIQRDYTIEDVTFSIYASGSLQEKGFFLSRVFSAFVTPRYKIHFLLYTAQEVNPKVLKKLILACKSKFGTDDWVFLSLVQNQPIEKAAKDSIVNLADKTIGIAAFSLASKEKVSSENVLGKGLAKQLQLTEAKFEAFDWPDYLKSFTIIFGLGILLLVIISLSGLRQAIQPLTLVIFASASLIIGYSIYKSRYHVTLTLNSRGFQLREGKKITEKKWSEYKDVTIYITPRQETCLRLHSKEVFDLPLSRVGLSRKEVYSAIRELVKKK
jgi:hypothetical protein